jgi:hypothetical protein
MLGPKRGGKGSVPKGLKKVEKREIDCLVEERLEVEKCRRYITEDGGVKVYDLASRKRVGGEVWASPFFLVSSAERIYVC